MHERVSHAEYNRGRVGQGTAQFILQNAVLYGHRLIGDICVINLQVEMNLTVIGKVVVECIFCLACCQRCQIVVAIDLGGAGELVVPSPYGG